MKHQQRLVITDCEGPISKNDNAFELTRHFIPEGEKLFSQLSRYDDVLADVIKREGYQAGNTLKLIIPFLKAYNVTNQKMRAFSAQNILLMPGAKDTLHFLKEIMPSFIVSTSYEHYIQALCQLVNFPYANTYSTRLDIDAYYIDRDEQARIKQLKHEICVMPLLEISEEITSLENLSERDQQTINRLDEIFREEIMQQKSHQILEEIHPVGGVEKTNAVVRITEKTGSCLSNVFYVGDSITDVECYKLVKQERGVTVAFNGNAYAIKEAEIAVLSTNAIVIAVLVDTFRRFGRIGVFDLADDWDREGLTKHQVNPFVGKKLDNLFLTTPPKVYRITRSNKKTLITESNAFRKRVRGEKIGKLG